MREIREARAAVYAESRGRSPAAQRELEERLARELGLTLRSPQAPSATEAARARRSA